MSNRKNREIKFRAWNGKQMLDWEWIKTMRYISHIIIDNSRDYQLMQYTELKDKNGKEIYDSDILTTNSNVSGIVKFNRSSWEFQYGSSNSEYLSFRHYKSNDFEIIGNIYENPNLCKM